MDATHDASAAINAFASLALKTPPSMATQHSPLNSLIMDTTTSLSSHWQRCFFAEHVALNAGLLKVLNFDGDSVAFFDDVENLVAPPAVSNDGLIATPPKQTAQQRGR